jgi:glutathione S-transferase
MADKLIFYTNPMSRGRIVRWMLEEVGQPYETVVLDYASTMKAPDYLAINPMGKVPAITHDDTVVTECAAICAYLADAFPQAGLAPAVNDKLRGPYYRWLFFAAGPLEAAANSKAMGWELPPDKEAMAGYGSLVRVMDALEGAVSKGPYILGDRFSAADVYVGAHIGWGMQFGTLEKRPAFETYFGRLVQRPAAKRAREIDDGLMAQAQKAG